MGRKVEKWFKLCPSGGRLVKNRFSYLLSFPTWRWKMSKQVKKCLKSHNSDGRLV